MIHKEDFNEWFRQIWTLTGASTKDHPAPFPFELAGRLVRMFSFHGDTVLDPFNGTGTTMLAALRADRNSIGIEIDPNYCRMALKRLHHENANLFSTARVEFEDRLAKTEGALVLNDRSEPYLAKSRKPRKNQVRRAGSGRGN